MHTRVWLSVAMAALGAAMLVAAAFAGPAASKPGGGSSSGQKKGGTMNINASATDVDYADPALAYGTLSWQILDASCAKLMLVNARVTSASSATPIHVLLFIFFLLAVLSFERVRMTISTATPPS